MVEVENECLAQGSACQNNADNLGEMPHLRVMGGDELAQQCEKGTHGGYYTVVPPIDSNSQ
ncbi:hypothetical protein [Slackia equolifaciens]|uniref:hypothetical protein n=1 Tax=Slackia equolifaciens TaxID=498718 RepID=UPI001FE6EBC4|nr:hypothetical protein [Slackia equolifaciens]